MKIRRALRNATLAGLALWRCAPDVVLLEKPDILLISIDTLRPDHLGCYGYDRPVSPNIDLFRKDAILFRTMIASAPSTLPAHASMFTSLAPQHHGASHTRSKPLAASAVTVTEVLRDAGYETAAIVGGVQLAPEFGLAQGFDSYELAVDETFDQVAIRALARLERPRTKPRFLFLHTYQVHHPYRPDPRDLPRSDTTLPSIIGVSVLRDFNEGRTQLSANDRAHIIAAYDGGIAGMDRGMKRLVAGLKRQGHFRDALIVFTSDHGEELGEHGAMGWHGHTLFDELLRVPLLVKLPQSRGGGLEVEGIMRGVDLAPMLLQVAGLPPHPQFQPFSLHTALARGKVRAAPILLWRESKPEDPLTHRGLRSGAWKLIDEQLYDLASDPNETKDLASLMPEILQRLSAEQASLIRERQPISSLAIQPSKETIEALRSLGYIR